jgi:uncharacterized membrane protein YuzA (DUF378 family)
MLLEKSTLFGNYLKIQYISMKTLHMVTWVLVVIGGLNWLLYVLGWDLGSWSAASWWAMVMKVVYVLVGLSALVEIFTHKQACKTCETQPTNPTA